MKKLVLSFIIAVSSSVFSQTTITISRGGKSTIIDSTTLNELNQNMQFVKNQSNKLIDTDSIEFNIINLINEYRVDNELYKLINDSILHKAAEIQSVYMMTIDSITHYNTSKNFHTPADRVNFFIKQTITIGECCFVNSLSTCYRDNISLDMLIVNGWKNSKPHNSILLSKHIKYISVSVSQNVNSGKIYTCLTVYS
jgi:uncharacterized protein YkwD